MPGVVAQHHHRSTTKTTHKPFKSRFTSKNALKEQSKGKVERGSRKTPHQLVMSKFDRRNQAKQKRLNKSLDHAQSTGIFQGRDGAPQHVVVVPLCDDIEAGDVVRLLNSSLDLPEVVPAVGHLKVHVDRFKQKLTYRMTTRDFWPTLSACQIADYVLFVMSPDKPVDALGEMLLRGIELQGITTVYSAVHGLDGLENTKRRQQVQGSLKSFITHFFPEQEKVFSLDARQDCQNLVRSLCTTTPRGIRWRDERSWMLVEDIRWPETISDDEHASGEIVVTGIIRGQHLKADRLAQLGDWGTFQIDRITSSPAQHDRKAKGNAMSVDSEGDNNLLDSPSSEQDTLEELAPEEAVMHDLDMTAPSLAPTERRGVLLDDQHYISEDEPEDEEHSIPRRLPKGTSKYQAAWYLGDYSDSGSDMDDVSDLGDSNDVGMMDSVPGPADGAEGRIPAIDPTEVGASEYPQSEFFDDRPIEEEADELTAYRERKKKAAAEDLKFPDEIELQPNVVARERLAKYRGLKSLRTSTWDTEEDRLYQPEDWDRLLDINDYKGARNKVLRDALVGGVKAGTRVHVYLRNVPLKLQQKHNPSEPLSMFSLLRHEHKRTAMNITLTLSSELSEPLKSKEELIVQYGPRRFVINPLFSQAGNTPNDVHKFERYLHPGRTAVASFTGPLMWGSTPALFFKRTMQTPGDEEMMDVATAKPALELVGHGTTIAPSTARIITKRAVLTGEPYKINRRLLTIRYMFFNAEDVAWFKALPLWTNRGRQGTIKESLGTHGYFKAMFDARVGMQEAIGISLYKRMWPRAARALKPGDL